jgi:hypothetical protein
VGSPLRPAKKAVKLMLSLHHELLTQMYIEERLERAAHERLLKAAERTQRAQRQAVALTARLGRTLVSVGQRLQAAGAA